MAIVWRHPVDVDVECNVTCDKCGARPKLENSVKIYWLFDRAQERYDIDYEALCYDCLEPYKISEEL